VDAFADVALQGRAIQCQRPYFINEMIELNELEQGLYSGQMEEFRDS
jgi:hypothetical protein